MLRLLLFLSMAVFAQDPPYLREDGWQYLLDGGLRGWRTQDGSAMPWRTARGILFDGGKGLGATAAAGDRIWNAPEGRVANLVSVERFGDVELYLEYLIPKGSNSGVYLQGLYEVQVFDSYGVTALRSSDGGGIYHRWIGEKPVGGSAPRVNASYPPGQWQSFHIVFRAPRFDGAGRKTENARFIRVVHNGQVVQENVEVEGGTRSHMPIAEAARNPLMLQGDHGAVAYRNVYVKEVKLP